MARSIAVPPRLRWAARVAGDIVIIVLIAIVTTTMRKVAVPVKQGFQCHDPRLMEPHQEMATVSNAVLYGVGFGMPAAVMILTESFLVFKDSPRSDKGGKKRLILPMVQKSFEAIVPFFFGGVVTHLTTNVPKYAIGRLRPNFFAICKPDWSRVNCTNGGYVSADICTGTSQKAIDGARVAFPSGHASLSMFFMLCLILYLQRRMTWTGCPLLRPAIQLVLFYMALYCGLTRLSDHLHHWEDVFAGDVMGAIIAVVVAFKVRPIYSDMLIKNDEMNRDASLEDVAVGEVKDGEDKVTVEVQGEEVVKDTDA